MSGSSSPLFVPEDRPIPDPILHILRVVDRIAIEQACSYMVVGATARDLLLYHVHGIPATRATRDVDFAMAIENWDIFQILRTALLATDEFAPCPVEQRLFFRTPQGTTDIPIDLIPFGGVAENYTITWPPHRDTLMTVAGFEDAIAACVQVQVARDFTIPVVSLAALAVLKIFAWADRRTSDKDAIDLYRVISTYADAGNLDRLYDSANLLLGKFGYDLELAGAALAGEDGLRLASASTVTKLHTLISSADFIEALAECIRGSRWPLQPELLPRVRAVLLAWRESLLG